MPTRQTTTLPTTQFPVADGNWDANRGPIQGIVIHTMDGTVEGANARFNDPASKVSAHYGVGLDGRLYQWVDEDNVAYQAGNYVVNQTTIGIEHEDNGDYNGVRPDTLYETSAKIVADICKFYDFPADAEHIFKHCDVIDKKYFPGGTSCPDSLDVNRIITMADAILNPPSPIIEPVVQQPEQTPPTVESTPPVEMQPQPQPVDQSISNPTNQPVSNTPDQTTTSPVEQPTSPSSTPPVVSKRFSIPKWSPRQALYEFALALVRLLVKYGVLKEVNC